MRQTRGARGSGSIRLILEWLGLAEPQRGRKEPVALPAWVPILVAAAGALLAGLLGALLSIGLRALPG